MRGWVGAWAGVWFSVLVCGGLPAQDVSALRDRLQHAVVDSSLDSDGLQPWHLKLDVQLFDERGRPTEAGSIEEWWAGRALNKVSYAFPSYTGTEIRNEDGYFRTKGQAYEPPMLQDVLEQVVHPMSESDLTRITPDLRKQKFGKVQLDCIMLDEPLKNVAYPPLGLFPTYCLDPGRDSLRITTELGSVMFLRNSVGKFQGRSVAVDLVAQSGEVVVAKAHLTALNGMKPAETEFTPGAEMESEHESTARIGAGVMAGSIVSKVQPVYPQAAKDRHAQGTVLMKAIIGRDGRVRSLHLISAPDPDLAMAAIAAVRRWTYKPYLLNGLPTEVDTTITVNFAFGPG